MKEKQNESTDWYEVISVFILIVLLGFLVAMHWLPGKTISAQRISQEPCGIDLRYIQCDQVENCRWHCYDRTNETTSCDLKVC